MQVKEDIQKEWYARLEAYHASRRPTPVSPTPMERYTPTKHEPIRTERPSKLVLSYAVYDAIMRKSGPFDIELVHPEDMEAPGWRVE